MNYITAEEILEAQRKFSSNDPWTQMIFISVGLCDASLIVLSTLGLLGMFS